MRSLFLAATVLILALLTPAPGSAQNLNPTSENTPNSSEPLTTTSTWMNEMYSEAGAEAESVLEVPGTQTVPVSESAAARWTRLCDGGLGTYNPDQADSYTVQVDRIGDATCTHTYKKSTAGLPNNALTIETSITWQLPWTLNGLDQGVFETFDTTTQTSHQVGEIQTRNIPNQ